MLIYANMPGWGSDEVFNTVAAVLRPGVADDQRVELQGSIEAHVPGWSALLVASGREALRLAIETLGLRGRRLGVPAYVCPSVLTSARAAAAVIVPIDCAAGSFTFDPLALQHAVDARQIDGIIATSTYGFDQDFDYLRTLGLPIIDDAAYQSGRVDRFGRPCGTRGDAGIWSFNFKALKGLGGGVLLLPATSAAIPAIDTAPRLADVSRWLNYATRSMMRFHIPRSIAPFRAADSAASIRPAWLTLPLGAMAPLQVAVNLAQWRRRAELQRTETLARVAVLSAISRSETFATIDGAEAGTHLVPVVVNQCAAASDVAEAVTSTRQFLYHAGIQTETAYPVLLGPAPAVAHASELASRLFLLPCSSSLNPRATDRLRVALARASTQLRELMRVSPMSVEERRDLA